MSSDHREELLKKFQVYDTTVDIVSCWESYTSHIYSEEFDNFYFDRFPSLNLDSRTLTPDFTVFFDESYGLIGEITRTFPDSREAIFTELDQLNSYDSEIGLQNREGDYIAPEICDILVIIEGSSAPQIGTRLQRIIVEEEEYEFSKNLVLMRYQFNQDALMSRYEFQRVTQLDLEFRDEVLDAETTLSDIVGEEGDYDTLTVYPKHFNLFKVQKPLCNDPPPGPYLATFLWHKIFPDYLSEDQYEIWQATDGQKKIPISVTAEELTERVNEYMQDGKVKKRWVRQALDFLKGGDLVEEEDEEDGEEHEIQFMGFVQDVGDQSVQEGAEEREQVRELANIFIRRYCTEVDDEEETDYERYEEEEEAEEDSEEQAGLGDFM